MSRADIAYLMMVALISCVLGVVLLTSRYNRYKRELERGHRNAKRAWKPFWID